jgi:homoserine O-acetyltransferase/O-succinyltransferase
MVQQVKIFTNKNPFQMESGHKLLGYHLGYTTLGTLNSQKNNVVWVFHALTANSNPADWWQGLIGDEKLFSPKKYFIVCVNMPGSCYGSIGPLDKNLSNRKKYFHYFPFFTTRDMIRAYQPLKDFLGIKKIHIGIGGSMGGQQLLEWAIEEPSLFQHIIPIATNAKHSPWAIAFNATQRMAITTDKTWKQKKLTAGIEGMKTARGIALLSYRHYNAYGISQIEDNNEKLFDFKSESYQQHQGVKLANRFNAFSYYFLSKSMDAHNVARGRKSIEAALKKITAKTLIIGISNDLLFTVEEQYFLAKNISDASISIIQSFYGHDGFLLEFEQIEKAINQFLKPKKENMVKRQKKVSLQPQY